MSVVRSSQSVNPTTIHFLRHHPRHHCQVTTVTSRDLSYLTTSASGRMAVRRASHANSWYSGNSAQLDRELSSWLAAATQLATPARAVICPHAGYSYSGPTAAYSFKQLDPSVVR